MGANTAILNWNSRQFEAEVHTPNPRGLGFWAEAADLYWKRYLPKYYAELQENGTLDDVLKQTEERLAHSP